MAAQKKPAQDPVPETGKGTPVAAKRAPAKKAAPAGEGKATRKPSAKPPAKPASKTTRKASPLKGKKVPAKPPKDKKPATETPVPVEDPLCGRSPQEAMVVDRYLATYNMAQAYIEAGYTAKN